MDVHLQLLVCLRSQQTVPPVFKQKVTVDGAKFALWDPTWLGGAEGWGRRDGQAGGAVARAEAQPPHSVARARALHALPPVPPPLTSRRCCVRATTPALKR